MNYIEYGTQHPDTILLLHGGGLSWWNYREAARLLEAEYHVILPVLDGHGGSDAPFVSIEENATRILSFLDERFQGQIFALAGVSLGGQIAVEILSRRPDICRYALLESTLIKPMKWVHALIDPVFGLSYGLVKQKWFARLQAAYLGIPKGLFEDYFRDTCAIGKKDMLVFLKSSNAYCLGTGISDTKAKVWIVAGGRELPAIKVSAKLLQEKIPGSLLEIIRGYGHGTLSLNHPERYVDMLRKLFSEEK